MQRVHAVSAGCEGHATIRNVVVQGCTITWCGTFTGDFHSPHISLIGNLDIRVDLMTTIDQLLERNRGMFCCFSRALQVSV